MKHEIVKLYNLPEDDPTALARRVDYLLEEDRFMCSPRGYEVGTMLTRRAFRQRLTTIELGAGDNITIPGAADSRGHMGKVLRGQENARDC